MKLKLLSCLLILLVGVPVMAAAPYGRQAQSTALTVDNTPAIAANKILMFVTNHGNFGRDLAGVFGNDYGTYFPFTTIENIENGRTTSPNYATGLWVGGVDQATGDTLVVVSEYSSEYSPGPDSSGTFMADRPAFKVYKLYADSLADNPNADYLNWPVDQGAPVDDMGNPKLIGDHMFWSVYNDHEPTQHDNNNGETDPLGLTIKQTVFAFERQSGSLSNCVFMRFRIYNTGDKTLNNCFISLWSDPDLGTSGDDLVGCDTLTDLGYCYNETNDDGLYNGATASLVVPAIGYDFFQGPLIAGTAADTALMWDTIWPGQKNMGLYSFNKYINGTDPDDFRETYAYMQGLRAKEPGFPPYLYLGDTTTFMFSGDPVEGTGDLDAAGDDRRQMQSTGPFTFAPGDSTEILAGMIVGQGGDYLSSVTLMKAIDEFAQRVYENGFQPPRPPAKPVVAAGVSNNEITLSWGDTSEVDQGDFNFEGYTVWQGESEAGPWTELATYDLVNYRVGALVDTLTDLYSGLPFPSPVRAITNSGLEHYYTTSTDRINGGTLQNLTDYYFKVSAFSWAERIEVDSLDDTTWFFEDNTVDSNYIPPGDRLGESEMIVVLTPQDPPAGYDLPVDMGDLLTVTQLAGESDAVIEPLVVEPRDLLGHTYEVTFDEGHADGIAAGNPLGVVWSMTDITDDTVLVDQNPNISADGDYLSFDGVYLEVAGPPLEARDWDFAEADPPNISPVAAVDDPDYTGDRWFTGGNHGGEQFFGGLFMEPNFWDLTSLGPLDYPTVELRFQPMETYTDINGDSAYTVGETYEWLDSSVTQNAFMYSTFSGGAYLGFQPVPFSAWDVSDPANPRQLNIVVRDRDQNGQWQVHWLADTEANPNDTLLPNSGDMQYNYVWILNTDYDPTGTYYGDGTGGTVDFWGYDGGNGVWDAAYVFWVNGRSRPMLGAECTFTMYPPLLITETDVFRYTAPLAVADGDEADLQAIKVVPNPFYLRGPYDPAIGNYLVRWHHLPEECTISIYNLAGDFIRKIEKDDSTPITTWNLQTENRIPVASGIYIYVVDAPGMGQKIGKMAVFYESETLQNY